MHFPRAALARQLSDSLQGKSFLDDAPNGMFLAAPRRTGKTVFLRQDLTPELQHRGLVVVYVDLWADRARDPADLLAEAIGQAITKNMGVVGKTVKAAKLSSVRVGGAHFDVSSIGKSDGYTLVAALQHLCQVAKKPVVLIIDEAQQALVSKAGEIAMAALKSARDQMNAPDQVHLLLVMSGSDRDKLLRLVNENSAPFLGSAIMPMPLLGSSYVDYLMDQFEKATPEVTGADRPAICAAFQQMGSQPQLFLNILRSTLPPYGEPVGPVQLVEQVRASADRHQGDVFARMESDFQGLSLLEQAVLVHLLASGGQYKPYTAKALQAYKEYASVEYKPPQVQVALEKLRTMDAPMVWKSARGEYAVENAFMREWRETLIKEGHWPPRKPASRRSGKKL
jgi:hypothetical protein